MARPDAASPDAAAPPGADALQLHGAPTRRRLLVILAGMPALATEAATAPETIADRRYASVALRRGPGTDPIPRLFAEFEGLLERHEAALACCDRIEATLLAQIGYPRVPLPPDWDGTSRFAGDADAIVDAVPSGRHRRRLQRILQRRQRRWDEAAHGAGLTAAQMHEATLDGAVLDRAEGLLATPAWTVAAVVLKLIVLLSTQEPGPSACGLSPWRELRSILMDLKGLAAHAGIDR